MLFGLRTSWRWGGGGGLLWTNTFFFSFCFWQFTLFFFANFHMKSTKCQDFSPLTLRPPTGFRGTGDDVTLQHSCTSAASGPPPSAGHMLPPAGRSLPQPPTPPHLLTPRWSYCQQVDGSCRFQLKPRRIFIDACSAVELLDCRK